MAKIELGEATGEVQEGALEAEVLRLRQLLVGYRPDEEHMTWYKLLVRNSLMGTKMKRKERDYFKVRGLEVILALRLGVALAEAEFPELDKLAWPWRLGIEDIGDNLATTVDHGGHLVVYLSKEVILEPLKTWFVGVKPIRRQDSQLADTELVELVTAGYEEYAHVVFDSIKSWEEDQKEDHLREKVDGVLRHYPDLDDEEVGEMYHLIGSEYRGLIWKVRFVSNYLPFLQDQLVGLKSRVIERRKMLRSKGLIS